MEMITKDSHSFQDQALMLALAVVGERIRALPKEDRDDMYELTKAFIGAESEDERGSAAQAMMEILDQTTTTTRAWEPPGGMESLGGWTSFVSKKIRNLRSQAGITQGDLASRTGLTQSHVSRLESGQHSPNAITLKKMADALGVPLSELDPNALRNESE